MRYVEAELSGGPGDGRVLRLRAFPPQIDLPTLTKQLGVSRQDQGEPFDESGRAEYIGTDKFFEGRRIYVLRELLR